jgi:hypothetical protein
MQITMLVPVKDFFGSRVEEAEGGVGLAREKQVP